ncbi:phosphatases II [Hypoxylon crocopeplum]|nr:phosphatases II [Hypoxylon crocopeplum]
MATTKVQAPLRHYAIPTAPYSARAPSPPSIMIPAPNLHNANEHIKVVPSYDKVDPASLSADDLKIITQNHKEQLARDSAASWTYENRHRAQPVLDFLYLGPSTVARDREWLRKTGITMLLAARDAKMAHIRLMAADKVAQELGIQAAHVDVSGYNELIRAFPSAVRTINDHMLNIYRQQRIDTADAPVGDGKMIIPQQEFRRGKVLVFCETGNDRSAGVVAAYLMSVLGMDMVEACQFVHFKRFCASLADDLKNVLKSYEEILLARRAVHQYELDSPSNKAQTRKRAIEDTLGGDEEMGGVDEPVQGLLLDGDRFSGRSFAPFIDAKYDLMEER